MRFGQKIAKYILSLIMLASMTIMLAQSLTDPIFNVYINTPNQRANGNYYLCDEELSQDIRIAAFNEASQRIGNIDAEIYANEADALAGNTGRALATYTNTLPRDIRYTVNRSDINPNNDPSRNKSYYVRITPSDRSFPSIVENITVEAVHLEATLPEFAPYCSNDMPSSIRTYVMTHSSNKYHWYGEGGVAESGLSAIVKLTSLGEGDHTYYLQLWENGCKSDMASMTLHVLGNGPLTLNLPAVMRIIVYQSEDIKNGRYTNTVLEQVKSQYGVELYDNKYCDLIWRDNVGNIIDDFENYIPDVPDKTEISKITVEKDCGCGGVSEKVSITLMMIVTPKPTVEDLEFCVGDSHASDGFNAQINLSGTANEAPYKLEFSENADMRDSVVLEIGQTHFDYTFDVSKPSTKTFYVRQQKIERLELNDPVSFSEIVPFDVVVKQPDAPVLKNLNVCANDEQSIPLSSISNESNLIWKDANDNTLSTNVPVKKRGDITVSAQKIETINGEQCLSKPATATIHVDSLDVKISGVNTLLPGQTGKVELGIKGSGNQTISWSTSVENSILGDANKNEVEIKMGVRNNLLTAVVTDGTCSKSANWQVQADLFQCPSPTVNGIDFCLNDPRAADGFDANITLENNTDNKSNYTLSVSKNPDMSGAKTLAPGVTHFDYTFDVSSVGTQTIYIQQTEISRNLSSAIIPLTITVSQPVAPSANTAAICLNDNDVIQLSELSTKTNLQWYDENRNELTTSVRFTTKGTHPLYLKQYEIVNGEKCWSELSSVNITVDSLGINLNGDNHLCPGSEGKVAMESLGTSVSSIQWTSNITNTLKNATSPVVDVMMDMNDIDIKCSVIAGVCSANKTWQVTVGTGKVSGKIKFTEGDKVRESNTLANVEFSSCGGNVSVEATIEHTSSDFTVKKDNNTLGTYSFVGDIANFNIEGAGTYTITYENDCETFFSFIVTVMTIQPNITTSKWSSCYGGYIAAEISNVDGCKIVWKRDGTEIAKETQTLRIDNVSTNHIGDYTYELVCDGCPADGVVSTSQPDIYSPLTITTSQSADTICEKDEVDIEIGISPLSDKVSYIWAPDNDLQSFNNGASATVAPFYSKSFSVLVKNGDCEPQTKTIKVNVHPQMNGNIEAGSIMCEGDSTQIDASSLEAERYEWKHTDSKSPIITVIPNGVENKYTVTAYRGKCVLEKDFTLMVGATPKLASVDSIGLDDVMINMETAGDYKFIVDGKANSIDVADNEKRHVGFGSHTLRIIDMAGCTTDTSFFIVEPPFEIQSFIKPNSGGKDATFRIPDAVIVYPGTTMNIYDRWGKKIATLTSADEEGWDGTYNGKNMPTSDYWYDLNVDAIDKTYFGHFTLIRE